MAAHIVRPGETLTLNGAVTNSGTLLFSPAADPYGASGSGVIGVSGSLTNTGTIVVEGGHGGSEAQGNAGASLLNHGVLMNAGTLAVTGGFGLLTSTNLEGLPALLSNTGTLDNTGRLSLYGGAGKYTTSPHYVEGARGATVDNSGVLTNEGSFTVGGGRPGDFGSYLFGPGPGAGQGAVVTNTGTIVNAGTVTLYGGTGSIRDGMYAYGGGGGGILDSGVLVNAGLLQIGSGGLPQTYDGDGGDGAFLTISGTVVNTGTIVGVVGPKGDNGIVAISRTGLLSLAGGTVTGASISNDGTIEGFGTISVAALYTPGAAVIADGGLLTISSELYSFVGQAGGSYQVDVGATLALTGHFNPFVAQHGAVTLAAAGTLSTVAATAGIPVISASGGTFLFAGGGSATLAAADTNLSVFLLQASILTLSHGAMVFATGSTGNDKLTAAGASQTLTGGLGADLLTGAMATGDTFKDTAAGLSGDTIGNFAGTDVIDITDIAPGAGLSLSYTPGAGSGVLTVSDGGVTSKITLTGSFTQDQFTTTSDGHGGVLIGLH